MSKSKLELEPLDKNVLPLEILSRRLSAVRRPAILVRSAESYDFRRFSYVWNWTE